MPYQRLAPVDLLFSQDARPLELDSLLSFPVEVAPVWAVLTAMRLRLCGDPAENPMVLCRLLTLSLAALGIHGREFTAGFAIERRAHGSDYGAWWDYSALDRETKIYVGSSGSETTIHILLWVAEIKRLVDPMAGREPLLADLASVDRRFTLPAILPSPNGLDAVLASFTKCLAAPRGPFAMHWMFMDDIPPITLLGPFSEAVGKTASAIAHDALHLLRAAEQHRTLRALHSQFPQLGALLSGRMRLLEPDPFTPDDLSALGMPAWLPLAAPAPVVPGPIEFPSHRDPAPAAPGVRQQSAFTVAASHKRWFRVVASIDGLAQFPSDELPVAAAALACWLHSDGLTEDAAETCTYLAAGLDLLGITVDPSPVALVVENLTTSERSTYGYLAPSLSSDNKFDGHVIVTTNGGQAFADPTSIHLTPFGGVGLPDGLLRGAMPKGSQAGGWSVETRSHRAFYRHVEREAFGQWSAAFAAAADRLQLGALTISANTVEILRMSGQSHRIDSAVSPRLRRIIDLVGQSSFHVHQAPEPLVERNDGLCTWRAMLSGLPS